MTPNAFAGGEKSTVVSFRFDENYVQFRNEQENPNNQSAKSDTHTQSNDFGFASVVDGHKSYPNYAGCIHCEADEFGFVEVFWNVSCFDSVQSAKNDEEKVKGERNDDCFRRCVAF